VPLVIRARLDDGSVGEQLPASSIGAAAFYTDRVAASHIMRQVILWQAVF